MAEAKNTFRDNLLRVVAILGLLAVLLLGAWGIIQVAFFVSGLFTNSNDAGTAIPAQHETVTISVPQTALPGQAITVNWKHQGGSGAYAYGVIYSCQEGLSFKTPVPTGALQEVSCNTPFDFVQATSSMSLTPVYSGSSDVRATITVIATRLSTGSTTASASAAITISGTKKAATPAAPSKTTTTGSAPKSTYVASGHTSNLYGYADLAVRINTVYSKNGNAYADFTVQNVGTNVAPAGWTFDATIPLQGVYTYPAGPQRALYPGDYIVYTLAWGGDNAYYPGCIGYTGNCIGSPTYGTQTMSVAVDPQNQVPETNESNNYASASYSAY
jgi:hypothetical protein